MEVPKVDSKSSKSNSKKPSKKNNFILHTFFGEVPLINLRDCKQRCKCAFDFCHITYFNNDPKYSDFVLFHGHEQDLPEKHILIELNKYRMDYNKEQLWGNFSRESSFNQHAASIKRYK